MLEEKMDKKMKKSKGIKTTEEMAQKERKWGYSPEKVIENADEMLKELFLNILKLCQLLSIFPISVACVECLFFRIKLQKTRLRNRMLDCTLDHLLGTSLGWSRKRDSTMMIWSGSFICLSPKTQTCGLKCKL